MEEPNVIKVGAKQRHLQIPAGWKLLGEYDKVKEWDMVANVFKMRWEYIDDDEDGLPACAVGDFCITKID